MGIILILIESALLIAALVLGVFWICTQDGDIEPWMATCAALGALLEGRRLWQRPHLIVCTKQSILQIRFEGDKYHYSEFTAELELHLTAYGSNISVTALEGIYCKDSREAWNRTVVAKVDGIHQLTVAGDYRTLTAPYLINKSQTVRLYYARNCKPGTQEEQAIDYDGGEMQLKISYMIERTGKQRSACYRISL